MKKLQMAEMTLPPDPCPGMRVCDLRVGRTDSAFDCEDWKRVSIQIMIQGKALLEGKSSDKTKHGRPERQSLTCQFRFDHRIEFGTHGDEIGEDAVCFGGGEFGGVVGAGGDAPAGESGVVGGFYIPRRIADE